MGLLRVFIAIELPQSIRDSIEKQTARLHQVLGDQIIRWVPSQNMHLTLRFIGEISTTHLEFLKQLTAQEAQSHQQFDLQISGLGAFPTSRRPHILWAGLHAPADLASLQKSIETGVSRLGYESDERPFSPHLTLGRVRQNLDQDGLQMVRSALDTIQLGNIGTTRVDSIHLIKSDLQPSGPIYTKLFSARLSKP
jgi:RNA 2',3'-cyclic 3'-phosphodiesterase